MHIAHTMIIMIQRYLKSSDLILKSFDSRTDRRPGITRIPRHSYEDGVTSPLLSDPRRTYPGSQISAQEESRRVRPKYIQILPEVTSEVNWGSNWNKKQRGTQIQFFISIKDRLFYTNLFFSVL